eukprot:760612-Hanusia_phi.AAC.1
MGRGPLCVRDGNKDVGKVGWSLREKRDSFVLSIEHSFDPDPLNMHEEQNSTSDDKRKSPAEDSNSESCLSENEEAGELSDDNSSKASESERNSDKHTDDESSSKSKNRKIATLSYEQISQLFHLKQIDAARQLGISLTAMKNMCRRAGIWKWPYSRKRAVTHFQDLSWLIKSNEGASGSTAESSGSCKRMPKAKEQPSRSSSSPSTQVDSTERVVTTSTMTVTVSSPQSQPSSNDMRRMEQVVCEGKAEVCSEIERQGSSMTISDYLHFENAKTLADYRTIVHERSMSPEANSQSIPVKGEPASPSKVVKASEEQGCSPPGSPGMQEHRVKRRRT